MGVVGRLNQYASMLATEFDETTANNPSITGLGTYYASEFNENVGESIVTSGLVLNLDAGNPASYPGSGTTWTDISGSGNNGTITNGSYSSENGGSIVFNGTNTGVLYTKIINSGDFTCESWVKLTGGNDNQVFGGSNNFSGPDNCQLILYGTNGSVGLALGNSVVALSPSTAGATSLNNWSQVIWSRSGSTISVYINGVFKSSGTSSTQLRIERLGNTNNAGWLVGNISNAKVYNRALSTTEITQNYNALAGRYGLSTPIPLTANVFPPYDPVYDDFGGTLFGAGQGRYMRQNTDKSVIVYNEIDEVTDFYGRGIVRGGLVLDLDAGKTDSYLYSSRLDSYSSSLVLAIPMDGANNGTTFTDESATIRGSGAAKTITVNGDAKTVTAQSKFYGSSGFFDGTGDYLSIASSVDFVQTGNFTMECWIYPTSVSGVNVVLDGRGGSTTALGPVLYLNGTNLIFDTGSGVNVTATGAINVNIWYHIAGVRSGNTWTLYINGSSAGSFTNTSTYSTNTGFWIGNSGFNEPYDGYIQDVRIYKGVAKYTSNFTPPSTTSGVTVAAASGALPIFNTTDAYGTVKSGSGTTWTDLSASGNNGTLTNGPTYSSANGGSIVFDGTDDYVSSFPTVISGVDSKTVNCWFNITTTAVRLGICGTRGASNGWSFTVNRGAAGNLTYLHPNGSELEVAAGIAINTWYNGCVTYDLSSATVILYLNGNQIGTPSTSFSAIVNPSFNGVIGSDNVGNQFPFSGNIAQASIYNRALSAAEVSQNYNALRNRFGL